MGTTHHRRHHRGMESDRPQRPGGRGDDEP